MHCQRWGFGGQGPATSKNAWTDKHGIVLWLWTSTTNISHPVSAGFALSWSIHPPTNPSIKLSIHPYSCPSIHSSIRPSTASLSASGEESSKWLWCWCCVTDAFVLYRGGAQVKSPACWQTLLRPPSTELLSSFAWASLWRWPVRIIARWSTPHTPIVFYSARQVMCWGPVLLPSSPHPDAAQRSVTHLNCRVHQHSLLIRSCLSLRYGITAALSLLSPLAQLFGVLPSSQTCPCRGNGTFSLQLGCPVNESWFNFYYWIQYPPGDHPPHIAAWAMSVAQKEIFFFNWPYSYLFFREK